MGLDCRDASCCWMRKGLQNEDELVDVPYHFASGVEWYYPAYSLEDIMRLLTTKADVCRFEFDKSDGMTVSGRVMTRNGHEIPVEKAQSMLDASYKALKSCLSQGLVKGVGNEYVLTDSMRKKLVESASETDSFLSGEKRTDSKSEVSLEECLEKSSGARHEGSDDVCLGVDERGLRYGMLTYKDAEK